MQVAYLNTNGFFGYQRKGKREQSNSLIAKKILDKLFECVEPDILFFAEFDKYSTAGKYIIESLEEKGYSPIYPDNRTNMSSKVFSYVVAFSKHKYPSEKSPEGCLAYKWNEIIINEYRIIGVHIPSSIHEPERANNYWDALHKHYLDHKEDKIIYIGDMNVYDEGTEGKKQFNKLMKVAQDGWNETHHSNTLTDSFTISLDNGDYKRVDYVVLSNNISKVFVVENFQDFYKEYLSDHSLIAVTIQDT